MEESDCLADMRSGRSNKLAEPLRRTQPEDWRLSRWYHAPYDPLKQRCYHLVHNCYPDDLRPVDVDEFATVGGVGNVDMAANLARERWLESQVWDGWETRLFTVTLVMYARGGDVGYMVRARVGHRSHNNWRALEWYIRMYVCRQFTTRVRLKVARLHAGANELCA
jgi:hypothetical protein